MHTLVFRSLKRTHDMFVADNAKAVLLDEKRYVCKTASKLFVCLKVQIILDCNYI